MSRIWEAAVRERKLLVQRRELEELRREIAKLRSENERIRAAMRRCLTCDYRLKVVGGDHPERAEPIFASSQGGETSR